MIPSLHVLFGRYYCAKRVSPMKWVVKKVRVQQFLRILYHVAIPLLGQEKLAISRELLVAGIACHNGVKVGQSAISLRSQDTPQALRLLLSRTERAGHLDGHICIG